MGKRYTDEEKRQIVERIDAENKQGVNAKQAAKNAGITDMSYRRWKKALKKKPKKRAQKKHDIIVHDLPEVHSDGGKLFLLYGDAHTLQEFMRGMK